MIHAKLRNGTDKSEEIQVGNFVNRSNHQILSLETEKRNSLTYGFLRERNDKKICLNRSRRDAWQEKCKKIRQKSLL